jgi:hypothetical protein
MKSKLMSVKVTWVETQEHQAIIRIKVPKDATPEQVQDEICNESPNMYGWFNAIEHKNHTLTKVSERDVVECLAWERQPPANKQTNE